jgi:hypothetical protein
MYVHRFAYRDGVAKSELNEAWGEAFKAFARSGNWGGVEKGVTHKGTYGTAWGGYRPQSGSTGPPRLARPWMLKPPEIGGLSTPVPFRGVKRVRELQ